MEDVEIDNYHIRKLWPFDVPAFRKHLKRLDPETRRLRFGTVVNDDFLDAYADTAHRLGTVVYGAFHGEEIHASAELRPLDHMAEPMAEAAFTVERPYQDHGIGSRLMDRIITTAQNRGIQQLYMICLRNNGRMQHMAGKFGARMTLDFDQVTGSIEPAHPTMTSVLEEGIHDAQGFVTAMLNWQR